MRMNDAAADTPVTYGDATRVERSSAPNSGEDAGRRMAYAEAHSMRGRRIRRSGAMQLHRRATVDIPAVHIDHSSRMVPP